MDPRLVNFDPAATEDKSTATEDKPAATEDKPVAKTRKTRTTAPVPDTAKADPQARYGRSLPPSDGQAFAAALAILLASDNPHRLAEALATYLEGVG
jgi:hypothetical protein